MPEHIVAPGDCISSLAAEHGLLPQTIWNHPSNAAVRKRRRDPNLLFRGDVIFIPERELKEEPRATERRHAFVRKGVPSQFKLRLVRNGRPRANKHYTLEIDGRRVTGTTDADGWVIQPILPKSRTGMLTLDDTHERIEVSLGHLDPIEEIAGVQQRLRNLGFYHDPVTSELDESTIQALSRFQRQQQLSLSGYVDDATKRALKLAHGS